MDVIFDPNRPGSSQGSAHGAAPGASSAGAGWIKDATDELHGRRGRGVPDHPGHRRFLGHLVRPLQTARARRWKRRSPPPRAGEAGQGRYRQEPRGYAGQLRVQSIPAVFAFVDGKPVDGFMGALPDSQVKNFVTGRQGRRRPMRGRRPAGAGQGALEAGRHGRRRPGLCPGAAAGSRQCQGHRRPGPCLHGAAATGGAGRGDSRQRAAPNAKDPRLDSVRARPGAGRRSAPEDRGEFESAAGRQPRRPRARFELAKALARTGELDQAADQLLTIIGRTAPGTTRRRASSC